VIFADEAQDLNVMHWKVMRRWDGHGHNFIHAGDDDQAIYSFMGASPDAIKAIDRLRQIIRSGAEQTGSH
jgi:superfamily I DNA/RNA helicase